MKNLNKVLAMVLVVVMAMSSVVFADFTDVTEETAYAEAVNVGAALGLFTGYEDGTFKPEGDITRAEFAAIVVRALNQEAQAASAASAASDFADVAEDHWAKGYINIVSKLGIVNGYGDGNFGPEDLVLYEQAVKMLVVALGYEPAIGAAGYPVGYLTKASEIGLTNGVKGTNGSAANRGIVAQLTVNALNIPLMQQTGYGTWVDYEVQDGVYNLHRTLLSENLGMVKLSAIITDTSRSKATASHIGEYVTAEIKNNYKTRFAKENAGDNADLNEGKTTRIYAGETAISDLVGVKALVYAAYDELEQEMTALYAAKDTSKDKEIVVDGKDINDVTVGSKFINFEYWENDTDKKPQSVDLEKDASVYVNGLKATTNNAAAVVAEIWDGNEAEFYGTVTLQLLDTDSEADFDTVFIEDYKTIVVDENNTARYRITAKNDESNFSYDPEEKSISATLYDANGNEMDFADLVEGDVFTYKQYTSGSKTVTVATVVEDAITGSVTSDLSDGTDLEYRIGDADYKTARDYITSGDIAVGDEGTFYLDSLGNIVYFEVTAAANTNYAYVVNVGTSGSKLDSRAALKLYTFDGQYGTINTASKVKVDGVSNIESSKIANANGGLDIAVTKDADTTKNLVAKQGKSTFVYDTPSYVAGTSKIVEIPAIVPGDVITYTVNSSGYITSIDRPSVDFNKDNAKGKFTEYTAAAGRFEYNESAEALSTPAGKLYITSNTIIMVAEENKVSDIEDLKEDNFMLFSTANIADEQEFVNARAFNVDSNNNVGFILVANDVTMANQGAIMAMTTGITSTTNDEGDEVYALNVLQDGIYKDGKSEAALLTADNNDFGLAKYTTFVPSYNPDGEVRGADALAWLAGGSVAFDRPFMDDANLNTATTKVRYYYGEVTDRTKKEFELTNGSDAYVSIDNKTNVYVYYSGANSNNKATIEDYSVIDFDDKTGEIYFDTAKVSSVYLVAREYDGDILDASIYVIK